VRTLPTMQTCSISNGSGRLPATTALTVSCTGFGKLASGTPFATVDGPSLPASVTVNTIAGIAGQAIHKFTPGLPRISTFNYPYKAASDGTYLYVTESFANGIRQIRLSDNYTSDFLDTGLTGGFADGTAAAGGAGTAKFNGIMGIVTDGKYLYVGDLYNCAIRRIEIATKMVTTVAGQGGVCRSRFSTTYADGPGTSITLGASHLTGVNSTNVLNLTALALSDDGKSLYFGDITLLRKLDLATGMVSTVLGKLGTNSGSGNVDGSFNTAYVATVIQGLAVNGNNLYMLTGNHDHTLRRVDMATQTLSTLALFYADGTINSGIINKENENLLASTKLTNPAFKAFDTGWGLALSTAMVTDGTYLYISALANNQVVRIRVNGSDNGIPTALVVSPPSPSYADGPGTEASFFYPTGMATDGKYLYVVELLNYTVRKITPNS
jgi:hypothetical protein